MSMQKVPSTVSHHCIPHEVVPVFTSHDAERQGEGGERPVKVDPTERNFFPRAEVGEDDGPDKGIGEDDEEEDKEEWRRTDQRPCHGDTQVLHDTLRE